MPSSCEMTNCLYHRRKWLSFVFVLFISNRFPFGFACTLRGEEKHWGLVMWTVLIWWRGFSFRIRRGVNSSIFSAGGTTKRWLVVCSSCSKLNWCKTSFVLPPHQHQHHLMKSTFSSQPCKLYIFFRFITSTFCSLPCKVDIFFLTM